MWRSPGFAGLPPSQMMKDTTCPTPSLRLAEFSAPKGFPIESYSPFCLKIHRTLRLAGLPYDSLPMTRPSEIKALNPTCQLPVLVIDGAPLSDSSDIVQWIDEARPGAVLPPDPIDRSAALLWEEFADTALNSYVIASRWADEANFDRLAAAFFGDAPLPIRLLVPRQVRKRVMSTLHARDLGRRGWSRVWDRMKAVLDQLDAQAPATGFWVSETPTAADTSIFGQVQSLRTPLTPEQRGWVESREALTRYLDRVDEATTERLVQTERVA